jgi:hypothetical protein
VGYITTLLLGRLYNIRKLHNEGLRKLNFSPSIIRMIESRMRWAAHVARMGRRGMHIGFWFENQKKRDN